MAALGNFNINDGLAVPVSRQFSIVDHDHGIYTWRYDNGSPVIGQPYIELRKIRDDQSSRKVRVKTVQPVMETVGSQNASGYTAPPKVAIVNTISTDFVINKRSTAAQIDDAYAFHFNASTVTQISDPIKKGLFGY